MKTQPRISHRSMEQSLRRAAGLGIGSRALSRTRILLVASASSLAFSAQAAQPNVSGEGPWAKSRIIVMPRAGLSEVDLASVLRVHGGKPTRIGQSGLFIVDLPAQASEKAVVEALAHNPHLKFAELDRRGSINAVWNDPYLGSEWHLSKIGAPTAWDVSQGSGVTIAVLDTGVDGSHPDLSSRMVPGWNYVGDNSNTSDVMGHGTKVAGSVAAASDNLIGVSSVTGQARIMPLLVADSSGYFYYSNIAQALTYAADHGARVATISLEGMYKSLTVQNAAQYMKSKGGLVAVSAGNNGIDENVTPTTTMIPVSATDSNDALASWSSYGKFVAMSAPGVGIWTTTVGGGYGAVSGTSFSSPITAGVIALIMAANPKLSNTQVETALYASAVDLGASGRDIYYGYGRVNAAGAVQAAIQTTSTADTQPPTATIASPGAGTTVSSLVPVNVSATDNVGVAKVDLLVNGSSVASDLSSPYAFSFDSSKVPNGSATLTAIAYDNAGNSASSTSVTVNVANQSAVTADSTPPTVTIQNPTNGALVSGMVTITTSAADNSGSSGIRQDLFIGGTRVATGTGSTLSYKWNTRKAGKGLYTIEAVATDAAGNKSSKAVQVSK
jgi:thermitase